MATKKETAEQKLLKMIESSSAQKSGASSTEMRQRVASKLSFLTWIKRLNIFLILIIIAVAFFLASEIMTGTALVNQTLTINSQAANANQAETISSGGPFKQLAAYIQSVEQRNIFVPFEEKKTTNIESTSETRKIVSLTNHLRLVGVAWLDQIETASVMIEDTEKDVTYFLQKGGKIGDIIVKIIYADSALLGYENEEMIIKYEQSQM